MLLLLQPDLRLQYEGDLRVSGQLSWQRLGALHLITLLSRHPHCAGGLHVGLCMH
jgi:hypothetical protein